MSEGRRPERAPWNDFPPVVRNGDLKELEKEPEYRDAKGGDHLAAWAMVERLVRPETVEAVRSMVGDRPAKIVPVLARESTGNNKIPLAVAEVLGEQLGLEVEYNIVQAEKVARTNKGADHRLAMNAVFDGEVEPGQPYVLVDDTLSMGGTISSLRGYIENRGGQVLGAAVMTAHPGALDLAVKPKMLADIERKHGQAMNAYWQEEFGHGIDQLTQGEAGHLRKTPTVDAIRDRIAAARDAAGWTRDQSGDGQAPTTATGEADSGHQQGNVERPEVGQSAAPGPFKEKAEAFKELSTKDLLERYPNDKAVQDAAAVQAVAGKFAQEKIPDSDARDQFLVNVRDRIADNLEHGRENTSPRVLEQRAQDRDDLEH